MTRRKPRHRPKVRRRNLFGSRMWWATCPCGWHQGEFNKADAEGSATDHMRKEAAE